MTESDGTPDQGPAAPEPSTPTYADRVYRSVPGVISGVLLLVVACWLALDAIVAGSGRSPAVAAAVLPVVVFPVIAFMLRPAVRANDRRMLVRNPMRTIDAPWAAVEAIRAGYSVELVAGGKKFQVWAVPVSLRQRKRATFESAKLAKGETAQDVREARLPRSGRPRGATVATGRPDPTRAWSDQVADTLRELAERNGGKPEAAGEVTVTWCWWVIVPTVLGVVALISVLATS